MLKMHTSFVLLFMLAASLSTVLAHPDYFHERRIARTCTEHPSKAAGGHLPPVNDRDITVTARKNGVPLKEVCPGETYILTAHFGGDHRSALMTVSGGTLTDANVAGCTNAMTTQGTELVTTLKSRWEVPCSLLGRVEVKVTTATNSSGAWLKGSSGFTILPLSKCPGYSKCKADSHNPLDFPAPPKINPAVLDGAAAAAGNQTEEQPADSTAGPLFFAVNQPVGLGGSPSAIPGSGGLSRSSRLCTPSSLGYQCSTSVAQGVVVHYSYGGHPPVNACTNKTTLERVARNSSSLMHFAIETEQQGFVGLGFPLTPGRMVPADAVIGRLDNATGAVKVHSYRLTAQHAGGIKPAPGWAHALGAVRRKGSSSSSSSSGTLTVCFSRQALAKASLVPNLDPSMVPVIWSSNGEDSFAARHDKDGSLIINMLSGQHAVLNKHDATVAKSRSIMHIAHAAAMIGAFCLFMPLAGLIARHRWMFTPSDEPYDSKAGGGWFAAHLLLQLAGCIAAIGSYVMAMLLWFRKHSLGFDRHLMYAPHCELGTGVMAMVGVQLLLGGLRVCIPQQYRSSWRMMHSMWGWATVAAGGANCVLGTFLMRDLLGMPWLLWLLPTACSLGGLLLLGMMLEVPRMRRVREVCCCLDDDVLSDTASTKSRLRSGKSDARVDINSQRGSTTTESALAQALAVAGRPTRTTSDQAEEFHLSPRSGFSGLSSLLGVWSPRLTGSTPAQIRTV